MFSWRAVEYDGVMFLPPLPCLGHDFRYLLKYTVAEVTRIFPGAEANLLGVDRTDSG